MVASDTVRYCFGGGGLVGVAWLCGVTAQLEADGAHFDNSELLGTSAGSWAAAAARAHISWELIRDVTTAVRFPLLPRWRAGWLADIAGGVFGDLQLAAPGAVGCVATATLRRQRVLLDMSQHQIRDVVAASSSIPGVVLPHTIDGQRYVDGGVVSATNIDLTPRGGHLVVAAPMSGHVARAMFGPFAHAAQRQMRTELDSWRQQPHTTVRLIVPGEHAALSVRTAWQLFDSSRCDDAYDAGRQDATLCS
jgi:NTE family protein